MPHKNEYSWQHTHVNNKIWLDYEPLPTNPRLWWLLVWIGALIVTLSLLVLAILVP